MKVAPVIIALKGRGVVPELVHTGQHYDATMSKAFFEDLNLPAPDENLGVGSGTQAEQTANVLLAYEQHLLESKPDIVVVVGDVNSTLAASLAAAKLGIPVAHIEAGLRSRDWSMPEEINRVLTDRLSRWLFTPSADADENLIAEGIEPARIHRVGNVMIDTLLRLLPRAQRRQETLLDTMGMKAQSYALMTMHRPSNVDGIGDLQNTLDSAGRVGALLPVLFPVHPRTRKQLEATSLAIPDGVIVIDPLGYIDFLALMAASRLVLTDSGGIQEETSVLGIPCLTLRPNTERPITCTLGTNQVVGTDPDAVQTAAEGALGQGRHPATIPLWDGHTAERIAGILTSDLG